MKFLDLDMHPSTLENEGVRFVLNQGHFFGGQPTGYFNVARGRVGCE